MIQYTRDFQYRRSACVCNSRESQCQKVAPSGGGSVHEESEKIFKPNVIVEEEDENWNVEGIMTAEKTKASGVRDKIRSLQEKFF